MSSKLNNRKKEEEKSNKIIKIYKTLKNMKDCDAMKNIQMTFKQFRNHSNERIFNSAGKSFPENIVNNKLFY